MSNLANVTDERQLKHLKIKRCTEGQEFSKHTDAWPIEGAPVSKGWVNDEDFFGDLKRPVQGCLSSLNQPFHNNSMTYLVYPNDIPLGRGGPTTFPSIELHTGKDGNNFYEAPAPMDSTDRNGTGTLGNLWSSIPSMGGSATEIYFIEQIHRIPGTKSLSANNFLRRVRIGRSGRTASRSEGFPGTRS